MTEGPPEIGRAPFGVTPDGTEVELFTLRSAGIEVAVAGYGAIVQRLLVPDRNGTPGDVVLGFPTLAGYLDGNSPYFGAIVGRYANRIARGSFVLDGVRYSTSPNEGGNTLHGGPRGFDKGVWQPAAVVAGPREAALTLEYVSPDGEMGFPGALRVAATYRVAGDGSLRLDLHATTDAATVVNLSNHTYWNLAREGSGTIDDHVLRVHASRCLAVDREMLPTGEVHSVAGTPLDFRVPRRIGEGLHAPSAQLETAGGYDFTYMVDRRGAGPGVLTPAADLYDPVSGRSLSISTTEPAIQLYSGQRLDGSLVGKAGTAYRARAGLALEAQHYPDSPNHPEFPSTVLRPGETFSSSTVWSFATD